MKWPNPLEGVAKVIDLTIGVVGMKYIFVPDATLEMQLVLAFLFAILVGMK